LSYGLAEKNAIFISKDTFNYIVPVPIEEQ
jgi:hypothetical protein